MFASLAVGRGRGGQRYLILAFPNSQVKILYKQRLLLREIVAAPSPELFKAKWDGALGNLIQWKVSLPIAEGLELDCLYGSFPNHSVI